MTSSSYGAEVLGKTVCVKFDGDYYEGVVTRFQIKYRGDNPRQTVEHEHYIKFGDDDDNFYCLADLEANHRLKWSGGGTDKHVKKEPPGTTVAAVPAMATSATTVTEPILVTPQRKNKRKAHAATATTMTTTTTVQQGSRKKSVSEKKTGGLKTTGLSDTEKTDREESHAAAAFTNVDDDDDEDDNSDEEYNDGQIIVNQESPTLMDSEHRNHNDAEPNIAWQDPEIDLRQFEYWLRNIIKSKDRTTGLIGPISKDNADQVLKSVRNMVSGEGLRLEGRKNRWPDGIYFRRGKSINLDSNFAQIKKDLKKYEHKYGKDLGNGWLGNHALGKLEMYRNYVRGRRERE